MSLRSRIRLLATALFFWLLLLGLSPSRAQMDGPPVATPPTTLIELSGFSYYLGCTDVIGCWVGFSPGTFYNVLNVQTNAKPIVVLDQLSEMNITTGGFTPRVSGVYETRMLMEGFSSTAQTLVSCGWGTTLSVQPPYAIVMIETQSASQFNNSHMTPLIVNLAGGTTYFMICWANNVFSFNNLTSQAVGGITPIPVIDFIIRRIATTPIHNGQ
jgi:hypothetical protein